MLAPCGTGSRTGVSSITDVPVKEATLAPAAMFAPLTNMPAFTPAVEAKLRVVPVAVLLTVESATESSGASGMDDPAGIPNAAIRRAACAALIKAGPAVTNGSRSVARSEERRGGEEGRD